LASISRTSATPFTRRIRSGRSAPRMSDDVTHCRVLIALMPPWSQRTFPADVTRAEVIENYQEGTNLECPAGNRSRGAG
jgi:hypothetical protein